MHPLTTRVARFEDYPKISALQRQYGLVPKAYEEWTHLWVNNPVYQRIHDWPIGWVLENENHEIVGYIGNVPLSYELGARQIVTTTSHALVVDMQYRAHSVPLLSHFFNQKRVDLFLDTTVNANAGKAHELFRARRVPAGAWDQSSFWITGYEGFLAAAFAVKGRGYLRPLAYPLSMALRLKEAPWEKTKPCQPKLSGIEIVIRKTFDDQFDSFWDRLRCDSHGVLLATRSRQMLGWHFHHALAQDRAWIVTVNKGGGSIAAYAVFYREDKPAMGLRRLRLVDFQALHGHNELLQVLLCWALKQCSSQGIHMLEAIGFRPEKQRIIDGLSPHKRKLSSWLYFYKTHRRDLGQMLENSKAWDPCCFDGDASL